MTPPKPPSSTDDENVSSSTEETSGSSSNAAQRVLPTTSTDAKTPLLEDIDKMTAEELADFLYALAEEVIASPQEYKLKMGLEQLDISEFDNIDLSTPAGRKKLAKLFRMLAELVLTKGKEQYLSSVKDPSKNQGRQR